MDNYGQVWRIYLEKGAAPYQERFVYEYNDSLYPLSDDLIDIVKATMTAWLDRYTQNTGVNHPAIPPKSFLDAFINIGKAIHKIQYHTYGDEEEDDEEDDEEESDKVSLKQLQEELNFQKKRADDLEAELLLRKKKD
jgi:hypothetical protein